MGGIETFLLLLGLILGGGLLLWAMCWAICRLGDWHEARAVRRRADDFARGLEEALGGEPVGRQLVEQLRRGAVL